MEIVLVILFAVLVMGTVVGVASSRRRTARRPGLERPPEAPRPGVAPPAPAEAEEYVDDRPQITPEVRAEVAAEVVTEAATAPEEVAAPPPVKPRFRDRLGTARGLLSGYWSSVRGHAIDDDTWDELEEALIRADVGVGLTTRLLDELRTRVKAEGIESPDALIDALKDGLKKELAPGNRTLRIDDKPTVWLFVGVNGVGKTTTIGKLGLRLAAEGRTVVMAAGDTFRAAAAEQLALWAERVGADVVRGAEGGDPGSVVFDAVERAAAKGIDVVLADTAGRLHTKVNLVEELKKVKRIAERPPGHLTEVLLVIDATTGQNGLVQAKEFAAAVDVTGIVLTKLDGSAKGGIALAIQTELGIPIKLVGLGESAEDLIDFDPDEYVEGLFAE